MKAALHWDGKGEDRYPMLIEKSHSRSLTHG